MRASTFRGEKQVTLQFKEFRIIEEVPAELKQRKVEVVDYRQESAGSLSAQDGLAKLQERTPALQIWAEGADKAKGPTICRAFLS